ncbi:hypothetical protein NE237_004470 [Protea cynaroides]|uniref:Uncharacterized protein n=1 Tax=Protea cynaroides TaxID=273540 RepID=A0A9Q0KJH3_9MAGN|nr:hypothetical protein NE237_004470 [Protea cynaroides]
MGLRKRKSFHPFLLLTPMIRSPLTGAIVKATKGSIEGIKDAEPGDILKLRINRVLNSGGKTSRRFGNSLGVVGLIFAGLENRLIHMRRTDDLLNSVVARLGIGALYKAASGPRSAAIFGALGGLAIGIAVASKQGSKRYEITVVVAIIIRKSIHQTCLDILPF